MLGVLQLGRRMLHLPSLLLNLLGCQWVLMQMGLFLMSPVAS